MNWLLSQGYAPKSSLKLVGDRFALVSRQRTAVMRSACSDESARVRAVNRGDATQLGSNSIEIDTLNVLITIEAALSGGVVLAGRDGTYRDMASIHGSYRKVSQTAKAIELVGRFLGEHKVGPVLWRIDRPVSNSGRLKEQIQNHALVEKLNWEVRLDNDPDKVLGEEYDTVASADAVVLDRVKLWANLARWVVDQYVPDPWIVNMVEVA